jgi:prepilin-type N-terminal cleavage/methylation domain-containing protein
VSKLKHGFTLIELLIVVAIIAILAAIAVPNFLEAQVRSKVSRVKADIRTAVTALEGYAVDSNKYPADIVYPLLIIGGNIISADGYLPPWLSTPVAYLTSARLPDPFSEPIFKSASQQQYRFLFYQNVTNSIDASFGDNLSVYANSPAPNVQSVKQLLGWGMAPRGIWFQRYGAYKLGSFGPDHEYNGGSNIYDPTNGTVSSGDIYRTQKRNEGGF